MDLAKVFSELDTPNWFLIGKYLGQPGAYGMYKMFKDVFMMDI